MSVGIYYTISETDRYDRQTVSPHRSIEPFLLYTIIYR